MKLIDISPVRKLVVSKESVRKVLDNEKTKFYCHGVGHSSEKREGDTQAGANLYKSRV